MNSKPLNLSKAIFGIFFFLFSLNAFSQADFKVQHIQDDVARTGGTNSTFTAVSSLNNVVELANNNRKTHAGHSTLSSTNLNGDDLAGARQLTNTSTLTYYREGGSDNNNMRFNTSLWEYIGPAAGNNELIVRGRYTISLSGTTNSVTQALSGITNANDCIPFITGIMNTTTNDDADSGTAIAYLENSTTLRVQKGSNGNNVTVYITVVEFTGSNWTVLHGDSGNVSADSGSFTLRDGSDGTGTATNVSAWGEAAIFSHFRADNNVNGIDDAIADVWPVIDPGVNNQTIDWAFDGNHVSAQGTNRHFVHVLNNTNLSVTRFQNTSNAAGENTIDITSAGLTSITEALIVGSSISSGTGTAYGRGWRNYYLNSTTQAAHWVHRSGNTMAHEIQIIDLSGLTTAISGPEINVVGNGTSITNGDITPTAGDDTDFGNVDITSGSAPHTFTIENLGTTDLTITSVTGGTSDFVITGTTSGTITAGNSISFTVTFDPSTIGTKTATISIANSDTTGGENPYTFNIEGVGTVISYCASNGDNSDGYNTGIRLVNFNTINNSTPNEDNDYSDFTAISTTVTQNTAYNLTVNVNTDGNYTVHAFAWIDWNQDSDFADAGETYDLGSATNTSDGATSLSPLSITIPVTATIGATRMRVSAKYSSNPTSCEINFDGEVEDYTIDIIAGIPGPEINVVGNGNTINNGDITPSTTDDTEFGNVNFSSGFVAHTFTIENLGSSNNLILNNPSPYIAITGDTADFTLTANPTTPITPLGNTTFTITFDPTSLGVKTATISIANNDTTGSEDPYTFNIQGTGIDLCSVTISAFPYTEDFEASLGDWVQDTGDNFDWIRQTGGTASAETGPSGAASGSYYLYTEATGNLSSTANIETPCFNLTGTTNPRATFFYHMFGAYIDFSDASNNINYMGTLNVDISTDGGVTYPTNLWTYTGYIQVDELSSWIPLSFDLSAYIGQTVKFRIQGITDTDYRSDIAIDNFTVTDKVNPSVAPGGVTSDLSIWLKADDGHSYTDGQSVSLWQDQGVASDLKTHKSGQEPTYKDNTTSNVNFNPVIEFDNPYASYTEDLDYSHDLTTNSQFLTGDYGLFTQEMFIVLIPDDTPITSNFGFMDVYCADSDLTKSEADATGIGFGYYTGRIDNEIIAYAHSTYNQSEAGDGYAVSEIGTGSSYTNIGIINTRNNTANSQQELYYNATNIETDQNDIAEFLNSSDTRYWLGRSEGWESSLNARVVEVISYSTRKSDANLTDERNKIQSYLAIKYGITLGVNGTSQDYVDSDGTVIWDIDTGVAAEDVFNYNITGIGRDDASELNQKQSKTVNTTDDITIGHGVIATTNSLNGTNFTVNKSFLVWGNDDGTLAAQPAISVDMSSGIGGLTTTVDFTAIGRTWKVTKKGTVGVSKISIPETMLSATLTPPGDYLMFISDSPTFSPTSEYRILSLNGSNLETLYEFTGTKKYLTFGYAPERTFVRSIQFDGVQDYLDAGDVLDLEPTGFTISAWIKRNGVNASIVSKRDSGFTTGYNFGINASGQLEMSWNGGSETITSSVVIPTSIWHQVAVVFDGTTAKLYIDGVEDTIAALNVPTSNSESFLIAAADGNELNTTSFFNGNIDEVRVWDVALTENQLRFVINQEIVDNTNVDGSYFSGLGITPTKNDINTIPWANLKGYYPMSTYTFTNCKDASGNGNTAALKNLTTVDYQTAPLPYVSDADGAWDTAVTWLNNTVQDLPNSFSIIDGTTPINWNIVEINHNISIKTYTNLTREREVLALMVNSNKLTVNGDNAAGTGNGLTVTHYLNLDGKIDLEGESQLIQTIDSDIAVGVSGELERDQQGEGNIYRYNDWSSPVVSDFTAKTFTVADVLRDGTTSSTPVAITFVGGYDGAVGPPISIANYWIYAYRNLIHDSYSSWQQVGSTATLKAGEGYLMKGTGAATDQNYVFVGKPNNGDITLTINDGNDYLVGNPYPSALDADQFLTDNASTITGTIYFWEHYGGDSHNLKDYQAGFASYNFSGSVATPHPDVDQTVPSSPKMPERYIAVGQGFFVERDGQASSNLVFNNGQRAFQKEDVTNSIFMKTAKSKNTVLSTKNNTITDIRQKFRIGFEVEDKGHRQLLLTIDERATDAVDWGFDGEIYDLNEDDMFWTIDENKYVIQATNSISLEKEIPLGIQIKEECSILIKIDALENIAEGTSIYIKDKLTGDTHDITNQPFEINLEAGEYLERFVLAFQPRLKTLEEIALFEGIHIFMNNVSSELQVNRIVDTEIIDVVLFNYLGQKVRSWNANLNERFVSLPIQIITGAYIVKVSTSAGVITKKIIIE